MAGLNSDDSKGFGKKDEIIDAEIIDAEVIDAEVIDAEVIDESLDTEYVEPTLVKKKDNPYSGKAKEEVLDIILFGKGEDGNSHLPGEASYEEQLQQGLVNLHGFMMVTEGDLGTELYKLSLSSDLAMVFTLMRQLKNHVTTVSAIINNLVQLPEGFTPRNRLTLIKSGQVCLKAYHSILKNFGHKLGKDKTKDEKFWVDTVASVVASIDVKKEELALGKTADDFRKSLKDFNVVKHLSHSAYMNCIGEESRSVQILKGEAEGLDFYDIELEDIAAIFNALMEVFIYDKELRREIYPENHKILVSLARQAMLENGSQSSTYHSAINYFQDVAPSEQIKRIAEMLKLGITDKGIKFGMNLASQLARQPDTLFRKGNTLLISSTTTEEISKIYKCEDDSKLIGTAKPKTYSDIMSTLSSIESGVEPTEDNKKLLSEARKTKALMAAKDSGGKLVVVDKNTNKEIVPLSPQSEEYIETFIDRMRETAKFGNVIETSGSYTLNKVSPITGMVVRKPIYQDGYVLGNADTSDAPTDEFFDEVTEGGFSIKELSEITEENIQRLNEAREKAKEVAQQLIERTDREIINLPLAEFTNTDVRRLSRLIMEQDEYIYLTGNYPSVRAVKDAYMEFIGGDVKGHRSKDKYGDWEFNGNERQLIEEKNSLLAGFKLEELEDIF